VAAVPGALQGEENFMLWEVRLETVNGESKGVIHFAIDI
jgi:hypothetical protein